MLIVALAFAILGFVCAITWNLFYPRFLFRLQNDHTAIWQELGCPKYIDFRAKRTIAVLGYLIKRDYLTVNDDSLKKMATNARLSLIGCLISIVLFNVLILITKYIA